MKTHNIFILLMFAFFVSCKEDDKTCPEEQSFTSFTKKSPQDFVTHNTPVVAPNLTVIYKTTYSSGSGKSSFLYETSVLTACPYEDVFVVARLELYTANPAITDTLRITETIPGPTNEVRQVLPAVDTLYETEEIFPLNSTSGSTRYVVAMKVVIPSQGSWAADSAYYFNKVEGIEIGSQYKNDQE